MRTPKLVSCTVTLPLSTYRALRREAREAGVPLTHWITMGMDPDLDQCLAMALRDMIVLLGEKAGCLGETCSVALLLGGIYLVVRRIIGLHIPLAVLASAFAFAGIAYAVNPDAYVQPFYHLTSGALLLGAFFIATDPVTAPLTVRGQWIFGAVIGGFTMLVRIVGEYPEGFMYAVLLANSVRPLIDRLVRPIPVGGKPNV